MTIPSRTRVQVVKWGNSQAVRLPKTVLDAAKIREGDELSVQIEDGSISLEPTKPRLTLEKLVAGITPANRHQQEDWGKPVGRELW